MGWTIKAVWFLSPIGGASLLTETQADYAKIYVLIPDSWGKRGSWEFIELENKVLIPDSWGKSSDQVKWLGGTDVEVS